MALQFCFCATNLQAAPYCAILFCILRFIQFGFENYEDIHVKVDPNYEWVGLADFVLKIDSGIQFIHLIFDVGMLIGCLKEKLWPLYCWITFVTLFLGFNVVEIIATTEAFDSSSIVTISMVLSLIEIFVSLWGILLVFGAAREIKENRKFPC